MNLSPQGLNLAGASPLLGLDEPPAYGVLNPDGLSPYLLLCEHASPRMPRALGDLGLTHADRMRHIGWDIGAQSLAEHLASRLDAALFSTNYSRLIVDCNRPLDNPSLMPVISETTAIPGNANLSPADRQARLDTLFHPFQNAVARRLDLRQAAGLRSLLVGVHSFTPVYKGLRRPWHAGILYAGAGEFAGAMLQALRAERGLIIGDNEPYKIDSDDYTVPVHGDARAIPALLIEVRHDLIDTAKGVEDWAARLTRCLLQAAKSLP